MTNAERSRRYKERHPERVRAAQQQQDAKARAATEAKDPVRNAERLARKAELAALKLALGPAEFRRWKGREGTRAYRERHPERAKASNDLNNAKRKVYSAGWHQANKERRAQEAQARLDADPEGVRRAKAEATSRWRVRNPEAVREGEHRRYWRDPDASRLRSKLYRTPDRNALYSRLRRARILNATGTHTLADVERQWQAQQGLCYWRFEGCTPELVRVGKGRKFHADHRFALSVYLDNSAANIVLSCPSCNLRKHAKEPHELGRLL